MKNKIDKYETLIEFLKIIAPGENYINLQMAQCDFVSDIIHKAVEGKDFDSSISPKALTFVKTYSNSIFKNLKIFLAKIKNSEFYECDENDDYKVVRYEIISFISIFSNTKACEEVCKYYKVVSSVYELLK
ncbi:MAG: hypothetical protein MJ188_10060 [Treponema sp.]|nr:hypothetical protein [Treponema sp.]